MILDFTTVFHFVLCSGMFDRDRSGTIDVNEFQLLYNYINQWLAAFRTYDRDGSGHIEEPELNQGTVLLSQYCVTVNCCLCTLYVYGNKSEFQQTCPTGHMFEIGNYFQIIFFVYLGVFFILHPPITWDYTTAHCFVTLKIS